jgi:hypothetical protein
MKKIILIIIVFGSLTSLTSPEKNLQGNANYIDLLNNLKADGNAASYKDDIPVLHLEQVQQPIAEFDIDQFFSGNFELSESQNTKIVSVDKKTYQQPEPTIIKTKLKFVENILKKAAINSYRVNEQIVGLQITALDQIPQAKSLLLKSGDIILKINGHKLSSKKEAYNIFKKVRKQPVMIVDLLHDGQTKKLLLDFQ